MAGWWGISKKFSFVVSVQCGPVVQTWWNYPTSVPCFPLELSLDFCLGGCSPHNPSYLAFRFSRIVIITERIVLPLIVIVMTSSVWTDKHQLQLKHNRVGRVCPFLEACSGDQRSNKLCLWVRKEAGEGDTAWSSLYSGGWAPVSQDWEHLGLLGNSATSVYLCCSWRSGKKTGMPITTSSLYTSNPLSTCTLPHLCRFWRDCFSGGLGQFVYLRTRTVHITEAALAFLTQTWMRLSPSTYSS